MLTVYWVKTCQFEDIYILVEHFQFDDIISPYFKNIKLYFNALGTHLREILLKKVRKEIYQENGKE